MLREEKSYPGGHNFILEMTFFIYFLLEMLLSYRLNRTFYKRPEKPSYRKSHNTPQGNLKILHIEGPGQKGLLVKGKRPEKPSEKMTLKTPYGNSKKFHVKGFLWDAKKNF